MFAFRVRLPQSPSQPLPAPPRAAVVPLPRLTTPAERQQLRERLARGAGHYALAQRLAHSTTARKAV